MIPALSMILVLFFWPVDQLLASAASEQEAAKELEKALHLPPDLGNGRKVYGTCAVCHEPEGWGTESGYYPQLAGQHRSVVIKQLADIRARNRDAPTMFPFANLDILSLQDIADVAAYIEQLPMTRHNGVGAGAYLGYGAFLYKEYCADCHGANGEGNADDHMPLIQGQHYNYLIRQFRWIRMGKRRNADREMVDQIWTFNARDIAAVMDYVSRLSPPPEKLANPEWRNPHFPKFHRGPHSPVD